MQKLHLVGFTTDHEGLILSARRGSRSGGYLLTIDDALEEAVDDLRARRAEEQAELDHDEAAARPSRVESALPVREIQARLRQGRSVAEVARAAGVDAEWIERFAPPVLAERAQVITKVRAVPLGRPRLGPSALPIGEAVRHHLADRGVALTADEFTDSWTARQVAEGRWAVRFAFHYRGRNQVLRFDLDESSGEVTAADRASSQLGYLAPTTPKGRSSDASDKPARPTVQRSLVTTGFRPDDRPTKPASRPAKERERAATAMRKAAAQRAIEGERAAARRAKERTAEVARKARDARAAAARGLREQRERERVGAVAERARVAAARKAAADAVKAEKANAVAAKAKAAVATRAAAEKASAAAKQTAARRVAAEKGKAAAAKQTAARQVAAEKAKAAAARAKSAPTTRATSSVKPPATKRVATEKARVVKVVTRQAVPTNGRTSTSTPARTATSVPVKPAAPSGRAASTTGPRTTIAASPIRTSVPPTRTPERVSMAPNVPADTASPATTRPQFRTGLVEKASEDRVIGPRLVAERLVVSRRIERRPAEPSPNGAEEAPRPTPDRPRRTRPLRAT